MTEQCMCWRGADSDGPDRDCPVHGATGPAPDAGTDPAGAVLDMTRREARCRSAEALTALWTARARALVEQALAGFDEHDPQPGLGAAVACLRVAEGELDASELAGYPFPGEPTPTACICPAALLTRGGYRGSCPAHSRVYQAGAGQ